MSRNTLRFFLLSVGILFSGQMYGQLTKTYHQDSLRQWTINIFKELKEKHPGFYRYTSKSDFDQSIDSTLATIDRPLNTLAYYKKIKPLIAKIGCLHTGVYLNAENEKELKSHDTLLPLELFINKNNEAFVTHNYSGHQIKTGTRLLTINGEPIASILRKIMAVIPSDGYNTSLKRKLLNVQFAGWYQTSLGESSTFEIIVQTNEGQQSIHLKGVNKAVFPTFEELEYGFDKLLAFRIENNVGYLTLHTFSNSAIKRHGQKYNRFIKDTFAQIESRGINKLVIDVRGNTGGSDSHAVALASYFFNQPFRYWDKIEVTEATAKEIKGTVRLFYKKPLQIDSSYHWQKMWLSKEFDFYEPVQPAKMPYNGETYIISDGLCMSSCADFVALMSYNNKAIVVGQETGGGYQGNTSGLMPSIDLPMGLRMTVPLLKYTNAVDHNVNVGRGTIPDHIVEYNWQDWVNKTDLEMQWVDEQLGH